MLNTGGEEPLFPQRLSPIKKSICLAICFFVCYQRISAQSLLCELLKHVNDYAQLSLMNEVEMQGPMLAELD